MSTTFVAETMLTILVTEINNSSQRIIRLHPELKF